jgi:hypothetical protein
VAGPGVTVVGGTRGWERECIAVGEIDGAPIPGDLVVLPAVPRTPGEIRVSGRTSPSVEFSQMPAQLAQRLLLSAALSSSGTGAVNDTSLGARCQ